MDTELLNAFQTVINYYKSKPKYLNVVGTELHAKMCDLENEIINYCNILELADCLIDHNCGDDIFKCMLCDKYDKCGNYSDEDRIELNEVNLDKTTLRLMYPNDEDLCDRLIKYQEQTKDLGICIDCCYQFNYDPNTNTFVHEPPSNDNLEEDSSSSSFEDMVFPLDSSYDDNSSSSYDKDKSSTRIIKLKDGTYIGLEDDNVIIM